MTRVGDRFRDIEKIEQLMTEREEMWELAKKDLATIDELAACLRWSLKWVELLYRGIPTKAFNNASHEQYNRCEKALAVQDSLSEEAGVPVAAFGGE